MFIVPALASVSTVKVNRQVVDFGWLLTAIFLILIIGFRFEVGVDWFNYLNQLDIATDVPIRQAISQTDPAYGLLNWITAELGLGIYAVNLIDAVIFVTGLIVFCRRQPNPWLALVVATPILVILVGMGLNRQATAIGFIMLALVALMDKCVWRFVLFVVLGGLFHSTALLFLPLAALVARSNRLLTLVFFAVAGLGLYFTLLADSLRILIDYYFGISMSSQGGGVRVLMIAFPAAVFLFFRKRFKLSSEEMRIWVWMSLAAIGCLALLLVVPSSSAVDRLALYLIPTYLFVYSRLPNIFRSGGYDRMIVILVIIVGHFMVQFVYFFYGTHAWGWIPYKSYLVEALK